MTVHSNKKITAAIITLVLGFALLPTGFLLKSLILSELDKGITEQICVPRPSSSRYDKWITNNHQGANPVYNKFYMWNMTNPVGFINGNKPEYSEVGPYVFREYSTKFNVSFSTQFDEVTYKQYSTHIFEPEMSGLSCNPNDLITNVNPAYLGVLELAGSEENLIKGMFPTVLLEVKAIFTQELELTLGDLLTSEGIYEMFVGALKDIFSDLFSGALGEEAINLMATWVVDFLTTYIVPLEDLVEFMSDAMPTAEEIFFGEWATDYFPEVQVNLSILFRHLLDVINDLVDFIVDLIFIWDVLHLFDAIKDALKQELMSMFETALTDSAFAEAIEGIFANLIQELGTKMIDEEGSETGEGVDIDGREPYNYQGPNADLNITQYNKDGDSGISQEQCQALWDNCNPNSLIGMDVLSNPVWFEALAGIEEKKIFLMDLFNLTETQLNLILNWINTSVEGWLKNICEYTINDWNSSLITTRTVNEWLFTAIDNLVNAQDPSRAKVSLFNDCSSDVDAETELFKSITINTGINDISKLYQTIEYDEANVITIWREHESIQGTDGTQFAPDVSKSDTLRVFVSSMLRVVDLVFIESTEIEGIDLLRFELSENTFDINPNYY